MLRHWKTVLPRIASFEEPSHPIILGFLGDWLHCSSLWCSKGKLHLIPDSEAVSWFYPSLGTCCRRDEVWRAHLSLSSRNATPNPAFSPQGRACSPQVLLPVPVAAALRSRRHHRGGQLLRLQRHRHPPPLPGREHDLRGHRLHFLPRCCKGNPRPPSPGDLPTSSCRGTKKGNETFFSSISIKKFCYLDTNPVTRCCLLFPEDNPTGMSLLISSRFMKPLSTWLWTMTRRR